MIIALIVAITGLTVLIISAGYLGPPIHPNQPVRGFLLLLMAFLNLLTLYVFAALWVGGWLRRIFDA